MYDDEGIRREKQKRDDEARTASYKKRSAAVAADEDEALTDMRQQKLNAETNKATKLKIIAAKTPNAINENILRFQVLKEIQPRFIRNQPA